MRRLDLIPWTRESWTGADVAGRPQRRARIAAGLPAPTGNGTAPPFEVGNQAALRHGGYSMLHVPERARELADEIRPTLPAYSPADEVTLGLFCTSLARIENATAALEIVDAETQTALAPYLGGGKRNDLAPGLQRLREDLRRWVETARRLANDLGLTPMARAKLGLTLVEAERAFSVVEHYRAREAAGLSPYDDEDEVA